MSTNVPVKGKHMNSDKHVDEPVEGICLGCKEHCEVNEDGTSNCCGEPAHVD